MKNKYKIIKDDNNLYPYAVFMNCGSFWQQVSRWYFYEKAAVTKMEDIKNGGSWNTSFNNY